MGAPERSTASWVAGGRSVLGAAHVRYGIPNQDAMGWRPQSGAARVKVLAVADGHGAAVHFRSAVGAHMAVEAALRVLTPLAAENLERDAAALPAIARAIVSDWREQVSVHANAHPLSQDATSRRVRDMFTPYGTTLIAAAVGPAGAILLQIGDGDLLLGVTDGELVRPLPDDVGLVGEQTYSLCQPDAESLMRLRWIGSQTRPFNFLMLSSDGLSKSFSGDDAFRAVAAFWRERIEHDGLAAILAQLDPWLSQTSLEGSGDDITLGFMVVDDPRREHVREGVDLAASVSLPAVQRRVGTRNAPASLRSSAGLSRRAVAAAASAMAIAAIVAIAYVLVTS